MAKTTNHFAELNGFTFTRGSKTKAYQFLVVKTESRAADRRQCERITRQTWDMNLAYHSELAAGIFKLAAKYPEQHSPESNAKDQADSQAWIAKGVEGHVREALERFDARAVQMKTTDGDTYYSVVGWTSRRDLAEKAASRPGCIILPVTVR